jgi:uncharacterized phage protein (TIGR01671 family)
MTREIKFRGKRIDGNNNWVYGSLITDGERCWIINQNNVRIRFNDNIGETSVQEVDPKTVGQYTGLKDKNGKEIYEGDIVRGSEINATITDMEVIFWCGQFRVKQIRAEKMSDDLWNHCGRVEVIGNIYESPDLLGEKQ